MHGCKRYTQKLNMGMEILRSTSSIVTFRGVLLMCAHDITRTNMNKIHWFMFKYSSTTHVYMYSSTVVFCIVLLKLDVKGHNLRNFWEKRGLWLWMKILALNTNELWYNACGEFVYFDTILLLYSIMHCALVQRSKKFFSFWGKNFLCFFFFFFLWLGRWQAIL